VNDEAAVSVVGTLHGGLYIVYLLVAFPLTRRLRLTLWPTVAVLLAGTVPVMTFIVERHISHRYIEPALAGGAAAPHPPVPEPRPGPADGPGCRAPFADPVRRVFILVTAITDTHSHADGFP